MSACIHQFITKIDTNMYNVFWIRQLKYKSKQNIVRYIEVQMTDSSSIAKLSIHNIKNKPQILVLKYYPPM